jgi:hypothetical protein
MPIVHLESSPTFLVPLGCHHLGDLSSQQSDDTLEMAKPSDSIVSIPTLVVSGISIFSVMRTSSSSLQWCYKIPFDRPLHDICRVRHFRICDTRPMMRPAQTFYHDGLICSLECSHEFVPWQSHNQCKILRSKLRNVACLEKVISLIVQASHHCKPTAKKIPKFTIHKKETVNPRPTGIRNASQTYQSVQLRCSSPPRYRIMAELYGPFDLPAQIHRGYRIRYS